MCLCFEREKSDFDEIRHRWRRIAQQSSELSDDQLLRSMFMGSVLSGRRGNHGGKPFTRDLPSVSLLRGRVDIARPGRPLLLVDGDRAIVMHSEFVFAADVSTSPCHMGGVRRWLVCPGCRARRQTLYIVALCLACRRCAGLQYPTQAMNRRYRFIEKADGLRRRLGWSAGVLRPWGERPKRMRLRTFDRLTGELQAVEEALLPDLSAWVGRALGRPFTVKIINDQQPHANERNQPGACER